MHVLLYSAHTAAYMLNYKADHVVPFINQSHCEALIYKEE